jgi:hypothetical protein
MAQGKDISFHTGQNKPQKGTSRRKHMALRIVLVTFKYDAPKWYLRYQFYELKA